MTTQVNLFLRRYSIMTMRLFVSTGNANMKPSGRLTVIYVPEDPSDTDAEWDAEENHWPYKPPYVLRKLSNDALLEE